MRTTAAMCAFMVFSGCNKAGSTDSAAAVTPKGPKITASIPGGEASIAFAQQLVDTGLSGVNPTGSSDFELKQMTFLPDGAWHADAQLILGPESVDCKESGTWIIDSMEGKTAIMVWVLAKTTCANRSAPGKQRVSVFLGDGNLSKLSFR